MNYGLILLLLLATSISASAGIRLPNGDIADEGDDISKVYDAWGYPDMTVSSEKTCGRVIKKKQTYCSKRRSIWKRNGMYEMIQHDGNMIIKTRSTRSERKLKKAF